jgi:diguanylate cyclase (GGDEF)-like protein
VLFLDLDYFKAANDQHGHDYGDEVLITTARRMENCIRQTDLLAQLGCDEFVACINLLNDTKYILTVGQKIQQAVSQFYYIKDRVIQIGVSIGISLYPDLAITPEKLLKSRSSVVSV